jgi:glycosyltransferase involved in cell wall biosynthesis
MTKPAAFFLTPEVPSLTGGGGGIRSASLLAYLQTHFAVDVATFDLPQHSRGALARIRRNAWRAIRNRPPLFDRFSGFEHQVRAQVRQHYAVAVVEHFWCAPYASVLRPHADLLVLDLHNIESELARSHARATRGVESGVFRRFAAAYERLEQEWLRAFDVILVTSEADGERIRKQFGCGNVVVYPNALPDPVPDACAGIAEEDCVVFSGNMEYHPNVEAVRWFHQQIWPGIRAKHPKLEWRLVGRNPQGVQAIVAGDPRVRLTGEVDDAVACIAAAKVCVVPLLSGSGTRLKILEAWSAKRAVVSTSLGAEGLDAVSGEHLICADDAIAFQAALLRLLEDRAERSRLGDAGYKLLRERFVWSKAWDALSALHRRT